MPLPALLLAAYLRLGEGAAPAQPVTAAEVYRHGFVDVHGAPFRLPMRSRGQGLLLVFLGHECPISNAYAPELIRIVREYAPRGVVCCLVYAEPDLSAAQARQHFDEFHLEGTALVDPDCLLARWTGATKMPEAVLLGSEDRVLYRGRIDNRFYAYGKQRPSAVSRDLRQALESVLDGKEVTPAVTPVIGCDIPLRLRRVADP